MSIAVSVVVCPSRILLMFVGSMSLIAAGIALAVGTGHAADLSPAIRGPLGALVFFLASFGFYHGVRTRKTIQLDISGTGQIRLLTVERKPPCADINRPHVEGRGEVVWLADGSTLWPHMLLLRFQSEDGRTIVVPVLPDSVDRIAFRALSVACRWISAQNLARDEKIF